MRVDRRGVISPLPAPAATYGVMRRSPDGRRLAVVVGFPNEITVSIYDLARHTLTQRGAANESASLMYYDSFRKGYVTTSVGSLKDATGSGTFDITPGSFVFTSEFLLGGKPARDRMTLSNMTPDGGTWKYELSIAGGPLRPAGEGTYRKVELP